jgi:hypothetical protein
LNACLLEFTQHLRDARVAVTHGELYQRLVAHGCLYGGALALADGEQIPADRRHTGADGDDQRDQDAIAHLALRVGEHRS